MKQVILMGSGVLPECKKRIAEAAANHIEFIEVDDQKVKLGLESMENDLKTLDEHMKENNTFIINATPILEDAYYHKAKHIAKGHQRAYKYHK